VNTAEFKDSPLGRIPVDWDVVRLGEVVDQRRESIQPSGEGKYNFVGLEHIRPGETKLCEYASDEGIRSTKYRFYSGDILYGKLRPYLDKAVLVDINGICSTDLIVLTPLDRIIPEFFIYFLHTNQFIQKAVSTTSGTNHPRTSWKAISKFRLALPPLEEQKRISEILQDVDSAIENVNKAIDVTEELKRGLMQRLLMEGINHTEFKDSPLGRIPVDWDVVKLRDVLLLLRNGLNAKQNKEGRGYTVTRIETISDEKIDLCKCGYVSGISENDVENYRLVEGDILFSHINSPKHIGKTAIYEGDPDFLLHGMNLLLLRPDKSKVNPRFLIHFLRLFKARKIFWAMSKKAVNQASINQSELGSLKIFLPSIAEQKKIAEIIDDVDRRLELLRERKFKLENIKRGLMNDLLTGKRRVRITS